jgi:hypothetical protein
MSSIAAVVTMVTVGNGATLAIQNQITGLGTNLLQVRAGQRFGAGSGDALGRSISYEKGRGVPADEGELVAAFTGNHGWFFRNRGAANVTLVLRTGGQYQDIKRAN